MVIYAKITVLSANTYTRFRRYINKESSIRIRHPVAGDPYAE